MRHQSSPHWIMLLISALAGWGTAAWAEEAAPAAPAAPAAEAVAAGPFIAGLAPYQRPAGAPVITEFSPPEGWRAQALHGVSEPVPPHLGIEDQGAWYTPFIRPGMTGPYDLREWHHTRP